MANSEPSEEPQFDGSRMIFLNDARHGGHGGGPSRPPYIVLTTEEVIQERPGLTDYVVWGQPEWSVWAGKDEPPVYLSLPDWETFLAEIGNPDLHHLKANDLVTGPPAIGSQIPGGFDERTYDPDTYDTGPALEVNSLTSKSNVANVELVPGFAQSDLVRSRDAASQPVVTPETAQLIAAKLRSADWTGIERRIVALPGSVDRVGALIVELDRVVERCGLTNIEQQKAKALTSALLQLVASPQPEWRSILTILTSPTFTALVNFQAIAVVFASIAKALLSG